MTWREWSDWYALTFALNGPQDTDMIRCWVDLFVAQQWTADDLHEVSKGIATGTPPRYRSEHLALLTAGVRELHQRRAHAEARDSRDEGRLCRDCQGSGMIGGMPLPNPPAASPWATCAVLCHCPLGGVVGASMGTTPKGRMIGYLEYSRLVPDWRDRQERYDRWLQARAAAESMSGSLDGTFGAIVRRLQRRQQAAVDP